MNDHSRAVVVDTSASPFARWSGIPIDAMRLDDGIWEPRRRLTIESTIYSQHEQLELTGRLANFRRTAGKEPGGFASTFYFDDSDVYKWIEAAAWAMATDPDDALDELIDKVVQDLADAQHPDGYLNTWYSLKDLNQRWTELVRTHELYCAGHLFQAAVAHHRATGKTNLMDVACRFADLICDTFGPADEGKRPGTDGHEEIELALAELGRETGERRYIDQAAYFLDARGYGLVGGDEYHQDHLPFRETSEVVGHAVRQVYLTAGAADVYSETGDSSLMATLERLWKNMTTRRMYVSSGIGSRHDGESFGRDFELPNDRAYTESCAAIGSVMWNWRMLLISGEARFADLIESTLYNAMLPGLSLSGDEYFYVNPLEDDGHHRRRPWFDCACCPPNLARTLASIGGYFATVRENEIALQLYAHGTVITPLPSGTRVRLAIETDYPWDGAIRIRVEESGSFTVSLRIPAWAKQASAAINGERIDAAPGEYLRLERAWLAGDTIDLALDMTVHRVTAHPYISANMGKVAVLRGPLLYCLESADNRGFDPRSAVLPSNPEFASRHHDGLLGGVTTLSTTISCVPVESGWEEELYRTVSLDRNPATSGRYPATLIPYFAWANREPGPMIVWIPSE